jgi:hypothetical protein
MRFDLGHKVTLKTDNGRELPCRVVGQKNGMLLICRDISINKKEESVAPITDQRVTGDAAGEAGE